MPAHLHQWSICPTLVAVEQRQAAFATGDQELEALCIGGRLMVFFVILVPLKHLGVCVRHHLVGFDGPDHRLRQDLAIDPGSELSVDSDGQGV